jgi:stalled ribosome alternative rescue factor ArfA
MLPMKKKSSTGKAKSAVKQPKYRKRVEKPKKGKGSYERKDK